MTDIAANQMFWQGISKLPDEAQKSFWDAGKQFSAFIGEPPEPIALKIDISNPPADAGMLDKLLFYLRQGLSNQVATDVYVSQVQAQHATWVVGMLQGDFNKNPTTGQIITGGVISLIPGVDQVCDVRDLVANILNLCDPIERAEKAAWFALGLTLIGFVPEIGSAVKTVAKSAVKMGDKALLPLLKIMDGLTINAAKLGIKVPWGRSPIEWLNKFDWAAAAKAAAAEAKKLFNRALDIVQKAISALGDAADAFRANIRNQLGRLRDTLKLILGKIGETLDDVVKVVKEKINGLMPGKKEAGKFDAATGGHVDPHIKSTADAIKTVGRVSTNRSKAFFWSGRSNGVGGADAAAVYAKKKGGTTLEMLIEERKIAMPEWDANNPAVVKAWKDISAEYAEGVSGDVHAVLGSSLRPGNVWETAELPALKKNPKVDRIIAIDPETGKETVIFSRAK